MNRRHYFGDFTCLQDINDFFEASSLTEQNVDILFATLNGTAHEWSYLVVGRNLRESGEGLEEYGYDWDADDNREMLSEKWGWRSGGKDWLVEILNELMFEDDPPDIRAGFQEFLRAFKAGELEPGRPMTPDEWSALLAAYRDKTEAGS